MLKPKRLCFTGGGSGGHLIPNLAIVTELKTLDTSLQFLYLGSRQPLDHALVKKMGLPFHALFTGKLRRYFSWQHFLAPFLFILGFLQAFYHLVCFWPRVVFTKGGHVGLPVALAAWVLRRPLVLHESDSVMGLANRLTAFFAKKVLLGFPGAMALGEKVEVTGNPVRFFIAAGSKEQGYSLTGFTPARPVLLVWGGSQGAQEINDMVVKEFDALKAHFQIAHVTGVGKKTGLKDLFYREFEYLNENLAHIYAITDLVFGRAGANSLAELAYLKQPNVLLPLKTAAHHHQEFNAAYFEIQGASLVLKDKTAFVSTLTALWENEAERQAMRQALDRIACRDAAQKIANLLLTF